MIDVLNFRIHALRIRVPHKEGTASADAYFAGNERGHQLWRTLQAEAMNAANVEREACHV